MMNILKTLPCLVLVALLGLPAVASADDMAYVDLQRAIREVEDGQEAMERLQDELAGRQSALDDAEESLRSVTTELEEELVLMDAETRQEALEEYQEQLALYQELYLSNQRELLEMEQEATAEIIERMLVIVQEIAEERDIDMVLEATRSSVVWASEDLDITDEVISRYEDQN